MIEHNIVFLLSFANKNITYKATAGTVVHLWATQKCLVSEFIYVLN